MKNENSINLSNSLKLQQRADRQHSRYKLTASERIEILVDPGSFIEIDSLVVHRCNEFGLSDQHYKGDGVIVGYGKVNNRLIAICSQDFTIFGGSFGEMHARKVHKIQDMALKAKIPIVFMNDSGGARIQEGVDSLGGYGEAFMRNVKSSGVIPQISVIMGPCAGGAVYSPGLTDFIFMVSGTSYMYVTGPDVVKNVTHEIVNHEKLGGSKVHSTKSGVCDAVFDDDIECLLQIRRLINFLPMSNSSPVPVLPSKDSPDRISPSLDKIVPDDSIKPYNMMNIIQKLVDEDGDFFEIKKDFAQNIITGFSRIDGSAIGIVANQPLHMAGCIDINASIKAARFIRFCDAFNIPILTLVDVPGFLPGTNQEHNGIIIDGAKLIFAYAEATVPKVTLIVRKAYGGAYIVMGSKHLGGDIVLSWENAEIAVMGADAAVSILYKNQLSAKDKSTKISDYKQKFATSKIAASRGFIDDVILHPRNTRRAICNAFEILKNKKDTNQFWKKHDNLPL
ncbi:acyl-CoA carboxylase subunit beta [Lyticum sinuosum]|uniref:Acyl-CoA carboxylase subunit beta n=1 Tax=Lyticum sinuosum TaxID=1332059 RepID=A0AAE4VJL8_9RICK|nr:acyl-CoA carboxylase subunit beta [Lyticum sinuosum]MDZ5761230.1 Acyl-CoA carboxylase subunit beta [Lyticum sinuosum]